MLQTYNRKGNKITGDQINEDERRSDVYAEDETTFPTNIIFPKEKRKAEANLNAGKFVANEDSIYNTDVNEADIANTKIVKQYDEMLPGQDYYAVIDLNCDEWIDICLKNFKCKKYLFVVDNTEKYKNNIIEEIINNRPYEDIYEFMEKVKCNKTVMIALIKSGAFDSFDDRKKISHEGVIFLIDIMHTAECHIIRIS